jgi:hypothetical protein
MTEQAWLLGVPPSPDDVGALDALLASCTTVATALKFGISAFSMSFTAFTYECVKSVEQNSKLFFPLSDLSYLQSGSSLLGSFLD